MRDKSVLAYVLTRKVSGNNANSISFDEAAKRAVSSLKQLRNSPFSWLLEPFPDFLDQLFKKEILYTRGYLLLNYDISELVRFFELRIKQLAEGERYLKQIPTDILDKIDALILIRGMIQKGTESRHRGGKTTGRVKQEQAEQDHNTINEMADQLLVTKDKREIAGIIRRRTPYSKTKIYAALKKHSSDYWK